MDFFRDDPRIADIINAGTISLALFLPQYSDEPDGCLRTIGAGVVAEAILKKLASELGIELEIIRQPTPHGAVEELNQGSFDVIILGFNEERRAVIDFTPTVFRFDFAYMVPPGSNITASTQVDVQGVKIAVPVGHASWMELKKIIKRAEILGGELPGESFAVFRSGDADVFALPREQLIDFSVSYPGATILDDGFGFNDVGFAVAKGREALRGFLGEFVEQLRREGFVQEILDKGGLSARGFTVSE
jgi:polar amino acid transport system substrate-binding protein